MDRKIMTFNTTLLLLTFDKSIVIIIIYAITNVIYLCLTCFKLQSLRYKKVQSNEERCVKL